MPGFISLGLNDLMKVLGVSGMFGEFAFLSTAESPRGLLEGIAGSLPLSSGSVSLRERLKTYMSISFPGELLLLYGAPLMNREYVVEAFLRGPHDLKAPPNIL